MSCPDCKDGFYYPFVGPPEPCQTCTSSTPLTSIKTHPISLFSIIGGVGVRHRDNLLGSLKMIGLIQPIVVKLKGEHAEIMDGFHRIAALRKWRDEEYISFIKQFPDGLIPIMEIK